MKTLDEIKEQYAKEHNCTSWKELLTPSGNFIPGWVDTHLSELIKKVQTDLKEELFLNIDKDSVLEAHMERIAYHFLTTNIIK